MSKLILRSFLHFFVMTFSLTYLVLWDLLGRSVFEKHPPWWSPPRHNSFFETLLSPEAWGWIWTGIGFDLWSQSPIAVPIGLIGGGLVLGLSVLIEKVGLGDASTLLSRVIYLKDSDDNLAEQFSESQRSFDAVQSWPLYLSGLIGICAGAGIFVFLVSVVSSLLARTGLALLGAALVAVAAVGWCVAAFYLWKLVMEYCVPPASSG